MKFFLMVVTLWLALPGTGAAETSQQCDSMQSPLIYFGDFPPYNYTESDQPKGIVTQIVVEILKRLNISARPQQIPWARSYMETQTEPNRILFSVSRLPARENLFKWVGPILTMETSFVGLKSSPGDVLSLEDAKSADSILVDNRGSSDIYLTSQGFTNLRRLTTGSFGVKMLYLGRADYYAANPGHVAFDAIKNGLDPDKLKVHFSFASRPLYIAFSKTVCDSVTSAWQSALEGMKKDGSFARIVKQVGP